jgi:molecular chaperone DnaK
MLLLSFVWFLVIITELVNGITPGLLSLGTVLWAVFQEDRTNIERGVSDLKEALKGDDTERINKAKEALVKASHKLAEEIYKAEAAKAKASGGNGDQAKAEAKEEKGGENVVDAEVVEETEKKEGVGI